MDNGKCIMDNDCIAFGDDFKLFPKEIPQLSIIHLRDSATNGSLNLQLRDRTGRSEMRNEYHQTTSPEIVSGHCPPDKRELEGRIIGKISESANAAKQLHFYR